MLKVASRRRAVRAANRAGTGAVRRTRTTSPS